jgi:hypothetical protein
MEKFRAFLEVLKKYHFWVLCGLILLLSVGSSYLAGDSETKLFTSASGQIKGKLEAVNKIAANADQPSRKYIDECVSITNGPLTEQVAKASKRLYDEMRSNNPLPILYIDNKKDQLDFEKAFEKIWGPMEDVEKRGELDPLYRRRYADHIAAHIPILKELIDRRKEVPNAEGGAVDTSHGGRSRPSMGAGGRGGASDKTRKMTGIVDWLDADEKFDKFQKRFTGLTPSTLDIMLAQEDLWVYETLLKVIRNTNDGNSDPKHEHYQKPESHKTARIKQILAMDIGKDAVESWAKCEKALFNLAEASGAPGADARGAAPPPPQTGRGGSMTSGANSGPSLLKDRYVDDNGKPLADPAQQPYPEFRMMPINLKVVIEQTEIPRLLAECANSAMRIDVRRVRILVQDPPPPLVDLTAPAPADGATTPATGDAARPMPHHEIHTGAEHGMGRGGLGSDSAGGKADSPDTEESENATYRPVRVEVQGIIYIYNPPAAQAPSSGTTPATPSGTTPAAPGGVTPAASAPSSGATPATPTGVTPAVPAPASGTMPAPPSGGTPPAPAVSTSPVPGAAPAAGVPTTPPATPPVPGGRR